MDERIYGLLGRKLGHSWSVPIHAALGNGAYRLLELEPDGLAPFLHRKDIGGLNVTIPYKRDVMPLCDEIDPAAEAIGSVNTIVRCADGKLVGYNTDIDGFLYMACRAGISLSGKKVVILGSGGASLTAQTAARQGGAAEVVVVSRFGPDNYDNLSRHADAEILVNATPVGMYPGNGQSPVDLSVFPVCQGVLDVIYNPRRTALLLQAEARSIPYSDGLPMLVAQAVAAEERFFNRSIPAGENERILVQLRREMTNLILIGMPGSGKTTVGEALSHLTGREAVDLDQMIETTAGCSIPEIFQREGESGFRARERAAAEEAGKRTGVILLTGGGIIKTAENYAALHQNGRIYQLVRDLSLLPTEGRPVPGRDLAAMWRSGRPCTPDSGTWRLTTAARWRTPPPPSGGIFVHILVVNGPNMNMLGIRQPEIYGHETYEDLKALIRAEADRLGASVSFFQSNHEGALVDAIQQAYFDHVDGIIINPAAYTHTSVALLDAVKAVGIPTVEVHVSDPDSREEFRRVSYIRAACAATIRGHGLQGYVEALRFLCGADA